MKGFFQTENSRNKILWNPVVSIVLEQLESFSWPSTLQISTAKLQLYYNKKDVLLISLRQLAVYYNLLYPYFLKVIFVTTDCHRKYDF